LQQTLKTGGSSQCTYTFVPNQQQNGLSVQHLWNHEEPLWRRLYNYLFTPSSYMEGIQTVWNSGTEKSELKTIVELASSHGFEIVVGEPTARGGVYCGSEYVAYPSPVHDYLITFTKK